MRTFAPRKDIQVTMIQTHLLKIEPPYRVLNIEGDLVRHIATLIEVREVFDPRSHEERIKTISHPVVDYGNNNYAGVVREDVTLEDCEILSNPLSPIAFYLLADEVKRKFNFSSFASDPERLVKRLKALGIAIEWPMKKDAEGFDTNEPEDRFEIPISIDHSEKGNWGVESGDNFFSFDHIGCASEQALLNKIRETRSSYYKAFSDHQFDIVFRSNMPEAQHIIAELNANPHL